MASRKDGYSGLQIGVHWLIVAMVAVQLLVAEGMSEMVEAAEEHEVVSATTSALAAVHYWLGIGILLVMFVRLLMRFSMGTPEHAGRDNALLNTAAATVHWLLYIVLIAVPISGLIAYYGIAEIGDIHALSKPILIVLVSLHILGALYNQFIRKDGTLMRMLRPAR